jgi:hypothetical protein
VGLIRVILEEGLYVYKMHNIVEIYFSISITLETEAGSASINNYILTKETIKQMNMYGSLEISTLRVARGHLGAKIMRPNEDMTSFLTVRAQIEVSSD